MSTPNQLYKQLAAEHAVTRIESGMVVGLGTGSTSAVALQLIGARLARGTLRDIVGVPTSNAVFHAAQAAGIPLTTLETQSNIDLTIDGADEVDPALNLIKGGGGALLREKIVAEATARQIIIVDESKLSSRLGEKWAVPVEVVTFGYGAQIRFLEELGATVTLRKDAAGDLFVTDHGNFILDSNFGPIVDPIALGHALDGRAGIVEHGLFLGLASEVIVAGAQGVQVLQR